MMKSKDLRKEAKDLNKYLGGNYDSVILEVQKQLDLMADLREKENEVNINLLNALDRI